jgi:hypothetical protein
VVLAAAESSALAARGKQVSFVSSHDGSQQLIPHGSYSQFGAAASSNSEEEMSTYTDDATSSNSASNSISSSFDASFVTAAGVAPASAGQQQQQQPLTPGSLAAAAAAVAAGVSMPDYSLSTDSSGLSAAGEADGATLAEAAADAPATADGAASTQQQQQPMATSPSPFSARKPPAYSLLSPISSTSTRPLRGAASSSMASFSAYSSMEVSELLTAGTSEDCGTVNMMSSEEGLAIAAEAALLYEQMYDQEPSAAPAAAAAVNEQQLLEAGVLQDPLAFEQLMAVEPSVLAAQQQQLIVQQVEQQQQLDGSVFEAAAEAAAAAAAAGSSTYGGFRDSCADAILSAAAEICALGEDVDASALLPKEDTLPPTALARFAAPAGAEDQAEEVQLAQAQLDLLDDIAAAADEDGDQFAIADDDDDDDLRPLHDQSAAAAEGLPGSTTSSSSGFITGGSSFSSASSSSSRLTKDQLPCLGLTVTVPDKAAVEAARLSAANADAAAAVAAAKPAHHRGGLDDLIEPPVAQEGLRLVASAHIIPHVDKVRHTV